jgi:site-specific DNA recombinase
VSPAVAASLDPSRSYGVWWYGKERHISSQRRDIAPDGTPLYKKSRKSMPAPREEWVAIPVPDSGIPRDLVLAARNAIKENKKCSNAGQYFWELTGGIMRCSECGVAMATNRIPGREARYYRCTRRYGRGVKACSMGKNFRGETTEATVWNFISGILKDPERLRRGLNQMVAKEHSPSSLDAEKEEKQWTKKLSDIECQKDRLLDLYLDQGVEKERYEIKRLELERAAKTVQAELERIRNRQSRIRQLERDRDALLETYTRMVPTHIDGLSPEERHRIYKMMNLSLLGHRDGTLEISWAYDGGQSHRSNGEPTPPGSLRIPGR